MDLGALHVEGSIADDHTIFEGNLFTAKPAESFDGDRQEAVPVFVVVTERPEREIAVKAERAELDPRPCLDIAGQETEDDSFFTGERIERLPDPRLQLLPGVVYLPPEVPDIGLAEEAEITVFRVQAVHREAFLHDPDVRLSRHADVPEGVPDGKKFFEGELHGLDACASRINKGAVYVEKDELHSFSLYNLPGGKCEPGRGEEESGSFDITLDFLLYLKVMDKKGRLIEYIRKHSFQKSDTPVFKLSSGNVSSFYFNLKKTTYSPEGQYLVGNLLFDKIRELGLKPKAIGGLTMGADPIATAAAYTSGLRGEPFEAMVIRKEPKGHGTMSQIEGNVGTGDEVIIIDDVVTTGGSTIKAIEAARKAGLRIIAVIILLDRGEFGGRQNIERMGYPVHSILTIRDFE